MTSRLERICTKQQFQEGVNSFYLAGDLFVRRRGGRQVFTQSAALYPPLTIWHRARALSHRVSGRADRTGLNRVSPTNFLKKKAPI